MKTVTHICDICKKSKGENDLAILKVKTEKILIKGISNYQELQIDICSDCLRKKGFSVGNTNIEDVESVKAQNRKTLEDKLLDILEDMGVAFEQ